MRARSAFTYARGSKRAWQCRGVHYVWSWHTQGCNPPFPKKGFSPKGVLTASLVQHVLQVVPTWDLCGCVVLQQVCCNSMQKHNVSAANCVTAIVCVSIHNTCFCVTLFVVSKHQIFDDFGVWHFVENQRLYLCYNCTFYFYVKV